MKAFGITDIGLQRQKNEDAYLIDQDRNLFLVCDGMGGHKGGDVASRMAIDTVSRHFIYNNWSEVTGALQKAIEIANQVIWDTGRHNEGVREMGTTITAAVVSTEEIVVGHVGDSSLFIVRDNKIIKITKDHTLAEQMFKDGLLKAEEMRYNAFNHVLTRALGVESKVKIDLYHDKVQTGDWILLCSDGLTNLLENHEILAILSIQHEPQQAARDLISMALSRGGHDNITIVLLRL